jgi:hypothetical protein
MSTGVSKGQAIREKEARKKMRHFIDRVINEIEKPTKPDSDHKKNTRAIPSARPRATRRSAF